MLLPLLITACYSPEHEIPIVMSGSLSGVVKTHDSTGMIDSSANLSADFIEYALAHYPSRLLLYEKSTKFEFDSGIYGPFRSWLDSSGRYVAIDGAYPDTMFFSKTDDKLTLDFWVMRLSYHYSESLEFYTGHHDLYSWTYQDYNLGLDDSIRFWTSQITYSLE